MSRDRPEPADAPSRRLARADFERPTLRVARSLLGTFVTSRRGRGRGTSAMIVEVEAYKGPRDQACHARNGLRTPRVEPLYGPGGTVYVYFVYGMHWMLNFSTAGREKPEGVLVRGVVSEDGELVLGPGRVTRHLGIDGRFDGLDATAGGELWLEDRGVRVPRRALLTGPRVGVDFAGAYWAARPWRFRIAEPWLQALGARRRIGTRKTVAKTSRPKATYAIVKTYSGA